MIRLYPDPAGVELRNAIAVALDVPLAKIILGNGSEELISIISRAVLRPKDRVVTLYPSFPLHEDYATLMGATVDRINIKDDMSIDVEAFEKAIATPARMVIFSNPMNPVGCWLSPANSPAQSQRPIITPSSSLTRLMPNMQLATIMSRRLTSLRVQIAHG